MIPANPGFEAISINDETHEMTRLPVIAWRLPPIKGAEYPAETPFPITPAGELRDHVAIQLPDGRVLSCLGDIFDSFYEYDRSLGR